MKENWLSEKLTSRLFPPSETFSVILIPPRNFYFYLIQFVMPILLAWSVRLKSYEGPLAPFRVISFYGFVELRSVEMAQGWLYLIQIFFQWFYRSQKREKRFWFTVKIKYIDRNLLPPPPPPLNEVTIIFESHVILSGYVARRMPVSESANSENRWVN